MPTDRILIVDDEPGVSRIIEFAAARLGLEVLAINESDQFEKATAKIKPTIIFLDIAMPGRDGVELIAHLSAANYRGKIVIMSGSDPLYIQMSSTIGKVRGLQIAGTLAKPFRASQVLELLKGLIT
jgi:DNA-binding response OmpR family regulator